MRTTITLDQDVEALVKRLMHQRAVSFKQAINETLRDALSADRDEAPYSVPTFDMGEPKVDLTHALRLAAALEDDESAHDLEVGR